MAGSSASTWLHLFSAGRDPLAKIGLTVPIRYMGTKRHIAHRVRSLVTDLEPEGRVLDLFSGMGAVTESLAGVRSVVANDALSFTNVFARCRFRDQSREHTVAAVLDLLRSNYRDSVAALTAGNRDALRHEQRALEGSPEDLADYIRDAVVVATSEAAAAKAVAARSATGMEHYKLATLYFGAGYFGLRQAIHLDSLRYAIDSLEADPAPSRDWLLAAWLGAASTVVNAPGHTAQFLRPNDQAAFSRIRRYWRRSVWEEFQDRLMELKPVGTSTWRRNNKVVNSDALDLLATGDMRGIGAVYADPPYTKDQYSRYYHVYETLYRYDYPDSHGAGRVRSDRVSTGFCLKTQVVQSFSDLFRHTAERGVPLILSYPSGGLLGVAGSSVEELAAGVLNITKKVSFEARHSTLGASSGSTTKDATENLYVCCP